MATLSAVNQVGESIAALLRSRRDLLTAAGQLGPVPAALDISHLSLSRLSTLAEPTAGLTISCYKIGYSDYSSPRTMGRQAASGQSVSLELSYLLAAWPPAPADEQSIIAWAMLELSLYPVLDSSLLLGTNVWDRGETVQIVPDTMTDDDLFRLWHALQHKYRLSTTFRARVVRIGYGPGDGWPQVVAARYGYADTDPPLTVTP
jgi:hypothetical protein